MNPGLTTQEAKDRAQSFYEDMGDIALDQKWGVHFYLTQEQYSVVNTRFTVCGQCDRFPGEDQRHWLQGCWARTSLK